MKIFKDSFSLSYLLSGNNSINPDHAYELSCAFYNWMVENCTDSKMVHDVMVLNGFFQIVMPKPVYDKIKPWIDRYKQETSTK